MPKKGTDDPFREDKTPAHDAMQLYLKRNLDPIVQEYYSRYYPDLLRVKTGIVRSQSNIRCEVSIQEPYKKHIVVDAMVSARLVHSKINRWCWRVAFGSRYESIQDDAPTWIEHYIDHPDEFYFITYCEDHLDKRETVKLLEELPIFKSRVVDGYFESLKITGYRSRKNIGRQKYIRPYKKLWANVSNAINRICWPGICEKKLYLGDHIAHDDSIFIELKPKILSFGDALRQIHEYSSILKLQTKPLLITPDSRFDEDFESEGIAILHIKKEVLEAFAKQRNIPIKEHDFSSVPEKQDLKRKQETSQSSIYLSHSSASFVEADEEWNFTDVAELE